MRGNTAARLLAIALSTAPALAQGAEPVALTGLPEPIVVRPLDKPVPDDVGLAPASDAGLPERMWSSSSRADLAERLAEIGPPESPAMQRLLHDVLRVRAVPPTASENGEAFFLDRVDALLAMGRLDTARALMERAGMEEPEIFRRWFDMTILTGDENRACGRMRALPEITPTYPARIFCLARSGDWPAAVVTLENARALEVIDAAETERLTRFLDEFAAPGLLPPPAEPTPLDYMLYYAMGEPLRTDALPLPFAHADLRPITGWMARIAAAERLARYGAIGSDRLWAIYSERAPAASGLPWDRVAAAQKFDIALTRRDPEALDAALPVAWEYLAPVGLAPALAARAGDTLEGMELGEEARSIARHIEALNGAALTDGDDPLAHLSREEVPETESADPVLSAIVAGLTGPAHERAEVMVSDGRIGETLLWAAARIEEGMQGNLDALTDGLGALRIAGQPETAFRAAIDLLAVDRIE